MILKSAVRVPENASGEASTIISLFLEHDPEKWVPVFGKDHAPPSATPGHRIARLVRQEVAPKPQSTHDQTACLLPPGYCRAFWISDQTRSGVAGISMWVMPYSAKASTIAFMTETSAPAQPASPQPLVPSGLVVAGTG